MKDAYSPIYQEYLTAFQVGYHQMAELQVVCPCCREAVFRAEREFANGPTAYFSHYRAPQGFSILECERRVASISSGDKERENQVSRNQSLAVFRAVLRDAVAPIPVKGALLAESDPKWRASRIEIDTFTMLVRRLVTTTDREALRGLTFRNSQRLLSIRGLEVSPTARPTIRSSIAADLVMSVFADNHSRTASYLVARSIRDGFHEDPFTRERTIHGRARTLEVALWNHFSDRPDRETLVPVLVVADIILRELERLPFEKMILNARAGLRPMNGVSIEDYLPKEENPEFQYAVRRLDREKVEAFDKMFSKASGEFRTAGEELYVNEEPVEEEDFSSEDDYRPRM